MYNLGLMGLKRLVLDEDGYKYFRAKLTLALFKGQVETQVFEFIDGFFQKYQSLPTLGTVVEAFPEFAEVVATEPSAYYLDKLQDRYVYDRVNKVNVESQALLKEDKTKTEEAVTMLGTAIGDIMAQKYRSQILDLGVDGPKLVLGTYYGTLGSTAKAGGFGWPYLDDMCSGVLPGDVVSIVGRPAMGKTWFLLYIALHNWVYRKLNVLFVSMEMSTLAIAQRCAAMYAGTNISQLKAGVLNGYASANQSKFEQAMKLLELENAKFYVVDGNLAASPQDIYILARQLGCNMVCVDGAYLMRSKNAKLNRFDRVADNIELMKRFTSEFELQTVASWQFNRQGSEKMKKKDQKAGLEDIGYSDAIGQISSIALGLMQEEGVATLETRSIDVMKGRNGEIGKFDVNWKFNVMDFSQVGASTEKKKFQLEYIE